MTTAPPRKGRRAHAATVTGKKQLSRDLVRIYFNAPGLVGAELPLTDRYIKLLFIPEAADYSWPFDLGKIKDSYPRALQPVTRTYTLRRADTTTGDIEVDFVLHEDEGLAGPWARRAEAGDVIAFAGPGGGWAPRADYDFFVLAGDEAAAPAIAAAVDALPADAQAAVFIEIADDDATFEFPYHPGVSLTWVARNGQVAGSALSAAVRDFATAQHDQARKTSWFIHGVAEMIKELRRFLFVDHGVAKEDVHISGYWRIGMTEDMWQSSKREFVAQMEEAEQAARSAVK